MKRNSTLSILNAISLLAVLLVNYLANAIPFNNLTTGEISDRFDVLFKPARYAFSIWGLIYLGLLLFAIYQALPTKRKSELMDRIGAFFIINCLLNICWLFTWHYELFTLSVILMILILLSLIKIYFSLGIGRRKAPFMVRWNVHAPFSLYLGWICVATIANITIYLDWIKWNGFGIPPEVWFIIIGLVGFCLSLLFSIFRRDFLINLVILWAYLAIALKNAGIPTVKIISWVLVILAIVPVIISFVKKSDAK